MTKIFNWRTNIIENEIYECAETIKKGGIVIFPTETVYGIGTNAFCKESVEKIYQIKQRPNEKPLSILLNNKNKITQYAIISNDIEKKIIEKFMPGPLTIILKKKTGVLDYISSGKDTIGIRIPNNNIIMSILNKLDLPIVAPSANISGKQSGIQLQDILQDFQNKVDICIDGGKCDICESSTIVQIINNNIEIIREGIIKKSDIEQILK